MAFATPAILAGCKLLMITVVSYPVTAPFESSIPVPNCFTPLKGDTIPEDALHNVLKNQLTTINNLIETGQTKKAGKRYLRLWRESSYFLGQENSMGDAIKAQKLISTLISFYIDHTSSFNGIQQDLAQVSSNIPEQLDKSLAIGFAHEFHTMNAISFTYIKEQMLEDRWNWSIVALAWRFNWPYLDKFALQKENEKLYATLISFSTDHSEDMVAHMVSFKEQLRIGCFYLFFSSLKGF